MDVGTKAQTRRATEAATIAEAFRITSAAKADETAVRTKGDEQTLTWAQLRGRVDALAGGLAKLGVQRGDTVALMLSNRPEFHVADLAAVMLGATPFSIYQTYAPNQIEFVVSDAEARVAIVYGFEVTCCPDPRQVMSYLPEVRPHWFFAVPRIWEKLKAGLETMVAGLPEAEREQTQAALADAIEKVRLDQRGAQVPADLA